MEIVLNSGVKINTSKITGCCFAQLYKLEDELHYAKTGEMCSSRIQMRITTHALAYNFPVCLIIEAWDDNSKRHIYFTEYHPDKESANKRQRELLKWC